MRTCPTRMFDAVMAATLHLSAGPEVTCGISLATAQGQPVEPALGLIGSPASRSASRLRAAASAV